MATVEKSRKVRKRKETQETTPPPKDVPTKEEYAIAGWMRKNIPVKKTKFLNHTVEYFTASKAIDQLMDSPWTQPPKSGEEALFTTRESIVEYMDVMLRHKLFHRARKIVVPESELKPKKKKDKDKEKEKDKPTDKESKKEDKVEEVKTVKKKDDAGTAAESSQAEEKTDKEVKNKKRLVHWSQQEEGEKKKRKIRLDMHLEQRFVDSTDAYVWLYEPTPYYYYFFGFLVVIAVIAVCLFPLWPSSVRQGVYYLSLAAAGFLVFILALAVMRLVVFCLIFGLTFGKHHVWLLPNLTEDVGFLASFWPLYKYDYCGYGCDDEDESSEKAEESEPKSEKNSSESNNDETQPLIEDPKKSVEGVPGKNEDTSETESEGSQPSQTGKDFEIVDREEIES